jgi:hypothetical protein
MHAIVVVVVKSVLPLQMPALNLSALFDEYFGTYKNL